jgi:hypothetical protein
MRDYFQSAGCPRGWDLRLLENINGREQPGVAYFALFLAVAGYPVRLPSFFVFYEINPSNDPPQSILQSLLVGVQCWFYTKKLLGLSYLRLQWEE